MAGPQGVATIKTQCRGVRTKVLMATGAVGRAGQSWESVQSEREK